jgi:predicted transcriptional regulator
MSTDARLALGLAGTLAFAPISVELITFLLDNDKLRARTALNQLVNYGMLVRNDDRWQTSHVMIYIYSRDELALSKEMLEHLALYYVDVVQKQDKSRAVDYA